MRLVLEVIACSVHDAREAERGGADRLEIVRELNSGGLTPPVSLVREIRESVMLPIRVMVRERDGYDAGTPAELQRMTRFAEQMRMVGVDGLVLGFLRHGEIDGEALDAIVAAAPGVPATFHHAFDELPDASAALGQLDRWPHVDRVLSAGGSGAWRRRAERLCDLARLAGARIVLAGGGIDREALQVLSRTPGIREAHVGRAARRGGEAGGTVDSRCVAALVDAMD